LQPPHTPDGLGLNYIGLALDQVVLVKTQNTADALWPVEQILRAARCGALIFWASRLKASSRSAQFKLRTRCIKLDDDTAFAKFSLPQFKGMHTTRNQGFICHELSRMLKAIGTKNRQSVSNQLTLLNKWS
jgi:hypothetical protein